MSIVASRRSLAKHIRKIKGKEGTAQVANMLGDEISDGLSAYSTATAETRTENKNIAAGAKEVGANMPDEKNLKLFDRTPFTKKESGVGYTSEVKGLNKDFFKNWGQKLNFVKADEGTYSNEEGSSYTTKELQTLGRMSNSKNPLVAESLARMSANKQPLSQILGTHPAKKQQSFDMGTQESTSNSSEEPPLYEKQSGEPELQKNPVGLSPLPSWGGIGEKYSDPINSEEFKNAGVDARKTSLDDSKNNDIGNNPNDYDQSKYNDPNDPLANSNALGHGWNRGG
jgi:hypothetical protein